MEKALVLTAHALIRLLGRNIDREWIAQTVDGADWISADPRNAGVERRYSAIPEFGDRILHVVCAETDSVIRIISVLFDRNARPPS